MRYCSMYARRPKWSVKMLRKKMPTIILNHHPYLNYWGEKVPKLILTLSGHKHIDTCE